MTEYEILDLLASDAAQMAEQFMIYLTLMSGYLLVSYFIGEKLSVPQITTLNALFIFATTAEVWSFLLTVGHTGELTNWLSEIRPLTQYESGADENGYPWAIAMAMGVCAALYFMWSVRHPTTD